MIFFALFQNFEKSFVDYQRFINRTKDVITPKVDLDVKSIGDDYLDEDEEDDPGAISDIYREDKKFYLKLHKVTGIDGEIWRLLYVPGLDHGGYDPHIPDWKPLFTLKSGGQAVTLQEDTEQEGMFFAYFNNDEDLTIEVTHNVAAFDDNWELFFKSYAEKSFKFTLKAESGGTESTVIGKDEVTVTFPVVEFDNYTGDYGFDDISLEGVQYDPEDPDGLIDAVCSVKHGDSFTVNAKLSSNSQKIYSECSVVDFEKLDITPNDFTASTVEWTIKSNHDADDDHAWAHYIDTYFKEDLPIPFTLKVVSYKGDYDDPAKILVFKIHNPAWENKTDPDPDDANNLYQQPINVTAQQIEEEFNKVYKQAVFKGKVTHMVTISDTDYDLNEDGLLESEGAAGANEGTEMKVIADRIVQYISDNGIAFNGTRDKIMVLAGDSADKKEGGVTKFYSKYAWIFTNDVNYALTDVIPHEYGHCKFNFLDNPYKDGSDSFESKPYGEQWDEDNIMSYGDNNKLRYWQWEIINNTPAN